MGIMTNSLGITYALGTSARTKFIEVSVTPPTIDIGEANNLTTHANTAYKTFGAKILKQLGTVSSTVNYDPDAYTEIIGALGVNQLITITFPDATTLAFYGYLASFSPSDMNAESDDDPTSTIVLQPTLRHSTTGVETAPVVA